MIERKYRKIEPIFTASQFTKRTEFRIKNTGYLTLTTFNPGDWFLRDQYGEEYHMTDKEFKKYYEEIPSGE